MMVERDALAAEVARLTRQVQAVRDANAVIPPIEQGTNDQSPWSAWQHGALAQQRSITAALATTDDTEDES